MYHRPKSALADFFILCGMAVIVGGIAFLVYEAIRVLLWALLYFTGNAVAFTCW